MLDMTVDYVKQREQFGVPIGTFQAIKHQLADAALALEFARPPVYAAAYALAHRDGDTDDHVSRDVSMAKCLASTAALDVARVALQCHGAIGYTVEYDLHLWMKRAWALASAWGDAAWHRNRVGLAVLGPRPPLP
jgi:alkylation response protein AidB-like acyl-CoA dehydrogenase